MHPSRFGSILDIVTRLLAAGTEAIAPTNPAVAVDLQLGLVLFGLVDQILHHMTANPPVALPTPAAAK
jgi:hypothetical protein